MEKRQRAVNEHFKSLPPFLLRDGIYADLMRKNNLSSTGHLLLAETKSSLDEAKIELATIEMSGSRIVAEVGHLGMFCLTIDTIKMIQKICVEMGIQCQYLNSCLYFYDSSNSSTTKLSCTGTVVFVTPPEHYGEVVSMLVSILARVFITTKGREAVLTFRKVNESGCIGGATHMRGAT